MTPDASGLFIGYGRLEDLVAAHTDPTQPFYVEFLTRRLLGDPLDWVQQMVVVQDIDEAGRVRYCRIGCGGYDLFHGRPFDDADAARAKAYAQRRHEAVRAFFTARGCRVERATIAAPNDLILLEGDAHFLHLKTAG